ncbi:MAG: ATP-binding protein [Clostridiaceae bacterium]|nr:ATP-binding protein [Clostridiaceae bacterium]
MKKLISVFLLLLGFVFPIQAEAQKNQNYQADYNTFLYTIDNGLTSNEITSIAQTSDEYIWVGAYSGLFRFDGNQFVRETFDNRINSVTCLLADDNSRLWIGTNNNGIACYNLISNELTFYTAEDGITANSIRCITLDSSGNVYVGTIKNMSVIAPDGSIKALAWHDTTYSITDLTYSEKLDIVAGITNRGTLFYMKDQSVIQEKSCDSDTGESFSCISTSADDNFLAGTSGNSVYSAAYGSGGIKCKLLTAIPDISNISKIYYSKSDNCYFIGSETGLGSLSADQVYQAFSVDNFDSSVSGALKDTQGNLWFVSTKQGVCKFSKTAFRKLFQTAGISPEVVNSVKKIGSCVYIGTNTGLILYDEAAKTVIKNKLTHKLSGIRIRHIMQDSKKNIWISTYSQNGLCCYKPDGTTTYFNEKNGASGNMFRFTLELKDGTIFAASSTGITFIENGTVTKTLGQKDGLSTEQILCAVEKDDGTILAGSDGGGIYVIKKQTCADVINEAQGISSLVILRIIPAASGYLYISSSEIYYDNGTEIRTLKNFPYSNNYDIYISQDQFAWVFNSAGIVVVSLDELIEDNSYSYVFINKNKGFDTTLTSNSWHCITENEIAYLCCSTGVRKFDLASFLEPLDNVPILVNQLLADNEAIQPEKDGSFLIPSTAKRFSIYPAVLDYTLSEPLVYTYLEGFDEQGAYTSKSDLTEITFTNLSYGSYRFHIQILNETTGEVLQESIYTIEKEPQFFEHRFFYIYLLLVCLFVITFFSWAIARTVNMSRLGRQIAETQRARREAEEANLAKTQFLANMSHEIRTPINAIMGMNELILRQDTSPEITQYANDIQLAGTTLLSIVNDILDLSKIESGKMNIVCDTYDPLTLFTEASSMLEVRAQEKGLSIKLVIDKLIPRKLYGDPVRIRQIISNLLSNAVKYTEKGEIVFCVSLKTIEEETAVLDFSVRDTGIGIRPDDIQKIFESFERSDEKRNANIQGTGLGLNITKQLLNLMGSDIHVESEYGKGSVFYFVLRQKIIDFAPMGNINNSRKKFNSAAKHYEPTFCAPDAKLLVVDDNEMNLTVFQGLLKDTKVQIDTALNGLDGLSLMRQNHYDLIFLDHMMPGLNGVEILEKIKEEETLCHDVPVIALTANTIAGAKNFYQDAGFTDYLAKPVSGSVLEKTIRKYLPTDMLLPVTVNTAAKENKSGSDYEALFQAETPEANPEIDQKLGLHYSADMEELYRQLLKMFLENGDPTIEQLAAAYRAGDWEDYEIRIHSLKSTAKTIGAIPLSSDAKALEHAASEKDLDYLHGHHEACMAHYRDVLERVRKMFD